MAKPNVRECVKLFDDIEALTAQIADKQMQFRVASKAAISELGLVPGQRVSVKVAGVQREIHYASHGLLITNVPIDESV